MNNDAVWNASDRPILELVALLEVGGGVVDDRAVSEASGVGRTDTLRRLLRLHERGFIRAGLVMLAEDPLPVRIENIAATAAGLAALNG